MIAVTRIPGSLHLGNISPPTIATFLRYCIVQSGWWDGTSGFAKEPAGSEYVESV